MTIAIDMDGDAPITAEDLKEQGDRLDDLQSTIAHAQVIFRAISYGDLDPVFMSAVASMAVQALENAFGDTASKAISFQYRLDRHLQQVGVIRERAVPEAEE